MTKSLAYIGMILGIGLLTASTATASGVNAGNPTTIPAAAAPGLKRLGQISGTTHMALQIVVKPRNLTALRRFDRAVSNPRSPMFRKFLTPEELRARYLPDAAELRAVRGYLASQGFRVTHQASDGLLIDFTGSASTVERVFDTTIDRVMNPHTGQHFLTNVTRAVIPSAISPYLSGLNGLDTMPVSPGTSTPSNKVMQPVGALPQSGSTSTLAASPLATSVPAGQKLVINVTAYSATDSPLAGVTVDSGGYTSEPSGGGIYAPEPTGPDILGGTGLDWVTNSNGQAQVYVRFMAPGAYSFVLVGSNGAYSNTLNISVTGSQALAADAGGYTPGQVNQAYNATGPITQSSGGTGMTVCVIVAEADVSGTWSSDLATYFSGVGLSPPAPQVSLVNDGSTWQYSSGWLSEAESDVERVNSAAPNAQVLVYDAPTNSMSDLSAAVNDAISNDQCQIATMSWSGVSPPQGLFATGVAEGITFFAASGDTGAYTDGSVISGYPANSANVTGVGGTGLAIGTDGQRSSEWAWSPAGNWDGTGYPATSGGGYTSAVSEPAYQSGVQSTGYRGTPDVSLMAGYGWYESFIQGTWQDFGGTSEASPTWAGYLADIESADSLFNWGNINPELYALATSSSSPFHAIQNGSSQWVTPWQSDVGYSAGGVWSPVTGLGTPNIEQLAIDMGELYPSLTSTSPTSATPGEKVTITGDNFGPIQGSGYVQFTDGGISWGAPGNGATFQIDSWSNTQIVFTVPTPSGPYDEWAVVPGTTATVRVVTTEGGTTSTGSVGILGPEISGLSPSPAYAGEQVTVTGTNFGAGGTGSYVQFQDGGVSWGAPGNGATFQIDSWSNTQIVFTVPTPSGTNGEWAVTPGTTASVTVVTGQTNRSQAASLAIEAPQPTVTSVGPSPAEAGQQVTVTGTNFGTTQGQGYVHFQDGGVSWGAPGNGATFQVDRWSNTQIVFTVPTPSGTNGEWAVAPGSTATVTVVTDLGASSAQQSLAILGEPTLSTVNPTTATPGTQVTVTGTNFGPGGPGSYVQFTDGGISWGAPGNGATFQIDSWSNTQIVFTVPTPSGPYDEWAVVPGTTATVRVVTTEGGTTSTGSVGILGPEISGLSPSPAYAGEQVTVTGTNFGAGGTGSYVQFQDGGVSWGAPGNGATFQIDSWSNTQIVFTVPTPSGTNGEWAVTPGTTASVTVVTGQTNRSQAASLPIGSA